MPSIPAAIVSRLVHSLTALPASRAAPAAKVHVEMAETISAIIDPKRRVR